MGEVISVSYYSHFPSSLFLEHSHSYPYHMLIVLPYRVDLALRHGMNLAPHLQMSFYLFRHPFSNSELSVELFVPKIAEFRVSERLVSASAT